MRGKSWVCLGLLLLFTSGAVAQTSLSFGKIGSFKKVEVKASKWTAPFESAERPQTFEGNVVVVFTGKDDKITTLKAPTVTVYPDKNGQTEKIVSEKNVSISTEGGTVTGEVATYLSATNKMEVTGGEPKVSTAQGWSAGNKITFDFDKSEMTIEGNVQMMVMPKEETKPAATPAKQSAPASTSARKVEPLPPTPSP